MRKIKTYGIRKIKIQEIIKASFNVVMDSDEEQTHLIKQQDTTLFHQLTQIRKTETDIIDELIYVEAKHNKKRLPDLKKLLREGFYYNGDHYVRFGKSSSQAKDGITVFIKANISEEMLERSQLGVTINKCIISKHESYRCLILSSCQVVEEELPYIVIVDEYTKIIPNQHVRYAVHKDIEYIDKDTGENRVFKNQKVIEEGNKDIDISPFDGFGVHSKKVSRLFSKYIASDKKSILFQIRLPFMKGVTVEAPFKRYYKEHGITQIKDVFGKWHDVDKIDCIWNTSMWKGYGFFKKEFGDNAWDQYIERVNKYNYQIGISKYNHHKNQLNLYSRLNFQYLQCLDLMNPNYLNQFKNTQNNKYDILDENNDGKIIKVAKYSTDLLEKIIKGDKLYSLKFLGINDTEEDNLTSKYIQAILINDTMLKDPTIKKMLKRKLQKTITQMKYGKIYAEGFYHTVVGDVIGYLQYAAGMEVVGCLNSGEFYAKTLRQGDCLSMRSPLVDPSEVNKVRLVENEIIDKYLKHFKNKDICMINMNDLTQQQQGGMDEDGDSVFLCVDEILIDSKVDKPIVVDMEDKKASKAVIYDIDNIITYECNSRDNRIGEITNIATSILNQYTENEKWQKINDDNISLLRLYQGKEIDFVKTGFRWIISKNLRKYLKKMPYFLLYNYPKKLDVYNRIRTINKNNNREDRIPYNAYKSPSAMNELCEYINQWEKRKIDWDQSVINNGHLLIDNSLDLTDKVAMKKIKSLLNEFENDFKETIDSDSPLSDLTAKYDDKLNELNMSEKMISNYVIKLSYRSITTNKTLCWLLYGDEMLSNLRENSDERKECKIVATQPSDKNGHEFFGRHYKLALKNKE